MMKDINVLTLKLVGGGSFDTRSAAAGGIGNTPPATGCASVAVMMRILAINQLQTA